MGTSAVRTVAAALAALLLPWLVPGYGHVPALGEQPTAQRPQVQPSPTQPLTGGWSTNVAPSRAGRENQTLEQRARANESSHQKSAPPGSAARAPADGPSLSLAGDGVRTRLLVDLTGETTASVFRLSNPWRVVVDLPSVELLRPLPSGNHARGLVTGVRAGLFAAGKLRVVLDTSGPVAAEQVRVIPAAAGHPARLEVVVVAAATATLRASEIASAAGAVEIDAARADDAQPARPRAAQARPVIVVDPGHGGIDPGAQGEKGVEKDIVLAVSREIRRALLATRRYEVVMTRSTDVFVALDQRVRISRQHNADLFLSIHADALDSKAQAQAVRGATVYTLADKATDARAAAVAAKENASDLLAGIDVGQGEGDGSVRDILVDLMRRESANFSADFRKLLVGEMRPRVAVARDPLRSAPFKVLRQPGSPAVLIELGYISNATDERLMLTQAWQRNMAEAVTLAVDAYFKRRDVSGR